MEACELTYLERQPIDIARARRAASRHTKRAWRNWVCEVISLPAEADYPDAVFVEDAAVVLDEVAVMTRMGAASRRGEADSLARALAPYRPLRWLREPATLDGGDVMLAGKTLYVGVTARSNAAGIGQLAAEVEPFGYRVRPVVVQGCLHLEIGVQLYRRRGAGASSLGGRGGIRRRAVGGCAGRVRGECAAIGETVLVPANGAAVRRNYCARLGRQVRLLDNSELMKAEGALTCCSLILRT